MNETRPKRNRVLQLHTVIRIEFLNHPALRSISDPGVVIDRDQDR
jgi:hypothetical protein